MSNGLNRGTTYGKVRKSKVHHDCSQEGTNLQCKCNSEAKKEKTGIT